MMALDISSSWTGAAAADETGRTGNRPAGNPESRMPMIVHGIRCFKQRDR